MSVSCSASRQPYVQAVFDEQQRKYEAARDGFQFGETATLGDEARQFLSDLFAEDATIGPHRSWPGLTVDNSARGAVPQGAALSFAREMDMSERAIRDKVICGFENETFKIMPRPVPNELRRVHHSLRRPRAVSADNISTKCRSAYRNRSTTRMRNYACVCSVMFILRGAWPIEAICCSVNERDEAVHQMRRARAGRVRGMTLEVYLIHATNDDGESLDWFVCAVHLDQAILLWREFLAGGEWCDDEEAERYRPTTIALTSSHDANGASVGRLVRARTEVRDAMRETVGREAGKVIVMRNLDEQPISDALRAGRPPMCCRSETANSTTGYGTPSWSATR